mmetsp:Transcript_80976/g.161467  ORF Transcript_80976/g.161467 Transcript_80976/m.161467 type:complete len:343 (+) Transcript_80976:653-1681(+)
MPARLGKHLIAQIAAVELIAIKGSRQGRRLLASAPRFASGSEKAVELLLGQVVRGRVRALSLGPQGEPKRHVGRREHLFGALAVLPRASVDDAPRVLGVLDSVLLHLAQALFALTFGEHLVLPQPLLVQPLLPTLTPSSARLRPRRLQRSLLQQLHLLLVSELLERGLVHGLRKRCRVVHRPRPARDAGPSRGLGGRRPGPRRQRKCDLHRRPPAIFTRAVRRYNWRGGSGHWCSSSSAASKGLRHCLRSCEADRHGRPATNCTAAGLWRKRTVSYLIGLPLHCHFLSLHWNRGGGLPPRAFAHGLDLCLQFELRLHLFVVTAFLRRGVEEKGEFRVAFAFL